ncbi:MAG: substrate-binding domain-containing protein [Ruminococcus sp.]|jgi:ribose transport system substrate-binding protein
MRKKILALGLVFAVTLSLFGCGGSGEDTSSTDNATTETEENTSADTAEDSGEESSDAGESDVTTIGDAEGWVINVDDMLAGSPFEGLTAEDAYSYQLIVKSFSASFFSAVVEGAEAAAEELGVDLTCNGPNTESDIADQVNMFNTAIMNGLDGIAIAPSDASAVLDSLKTAKENGVPVVAFDSGVENAPEGSLLGTVATDSVAAGRIGAENVYNAVSYKVSDGPIRIGMVANDSTSASNTLRGLGFVDGIIELGKADGYNVAVTGNEWFTANCSDAGDESTADIIVECRVPATALVDLCASEVSAVCNKADTVAVFGTNQTVTEGIIMANSNLQVFGSDPETSIIGTGFDAGAVIKENVANGTLYGCVTQMPYAMGYYSIATLVANNNGDEVGDLSIPAYWYNADNMNDPLIAPNLYD